MSSPPSARPLKRKHSKKGKAARPVSWALSGRVADPNLLFSFFSPFCQTSQPVRFFLGSRVSTVGLALNSSSPPSVVVVLDAAFLMAAV